jgi:hypothetical protein
MAPNAVDSSASGFTSSLTGDFLIPELTATGVEVDPFSETLNSNRITQLHIPAEGILQSHRTEHLESQIFPDSSFTFFLQFIIQRSITHVFDREM